MSDSRLEKLDMKLLKQRDRIESLYFKRDMGKEISSDKIGIEQGKLNKLLISCEPELKLIKKSVNGNLVKRKLELLEEKIIEARVVENEELVNRQNNIWQAMSDFFKNKNSSFSERNKNLKYSDDCVIREKSYEQVGLFLSSNIKELKKTVAMANKISRSSGFKNILEAKAFAEGTNLGSTVKLIETIEKNTRGYWKKILDRVSNIIGEKEIRFHDLYYGIERLCNQGSPLTEERFYSTIDRTLNKLGIDFKKLPIKITGVVNAPPAAVYVPNLAKEADERNITIAIDPHSGWGAYSLFFHEFGHAYYYLNSPSSYLLTDPHVSREIMAEMWVGFIEQVEWMMLNDFASDEVAARKILELKEAYDIFQLRMQILEAKFELSIYTDPECDFEKTWRKLSRKIIGIEDDLGVYSEFVFIHPFDIKNYIMAWSAKQKFKEYLKDKFGSDVLNPKAVELLVSNYYVPGAVVPPREKLSLLQIPKSNYRKRV
jgi:hypothetical protein